MKRLNKLLKRFRFLISLGLILGLACLIFMSGLQLPFIIALIMLLCAICADFTTTYLCLRAGGQEGNPLVSFLLKKLGVVGAFAVMAGIIALLIMTQFIPSGASSQTAVAMVYWIVPANNAMVLRRLRRA